MNPINGKIAVAVCGTLFIVEMLTASAISLVFAEDSSRDAAEPLVVLKSADVLSVAEIVSEDSYDADEIYKMGLELCESHMTEDILVRDWENPEIIDFKLLHSFETGYVRYALYEISYDDGHFASFIYDIEDGVCEQFGDGKSIFTVFEEYVDAGKVTRLSDELLKGEHYYFCHAMSYGYGVIGDDGLIDIYNMYSLLETDIYPEVEVLSDVSFPNTLLQNDEPRVRRVVGGAEKEAYAAARQEKADEIAARKMAENCE